MRKKVTKIGFIFSLVTILFTLAVAPVSAIPVFTSITQPDAAYLSATTKIDISGLAEYSNHTSISDGVLTVNFSNTVHKQTVGVSWSTWSSPPWSESPTPAILHNPSTSLIMNLSQPVITFGFELEPNPFTTITYNVQFILMSGPTVIGVINMPVNGNAGARLFAASVTGGSFDQIIINGGADFAIAQVRYNPTINVDIDIKPMSDPNSINLKRDKGVIPVAILTTSSFDATTVDGTTVMFAGASPVHDMTDPLVVADHLQDVDLDGDIDFVFHFAKADTSIVSGDTSATLTGTTLGGIPIMGSDAILTRH